MRREIRKFAILEHHWNGIHWDFLVEDGPSLRTWAIDEPLIAGHELAARALAPHRWIYLDFEGEISGGRGWVKRWDSGTCEVLDWEESLVRLRVAGSQIAGEVVFRSSVFNEVRRWVFCFGKLS